jgi:hypothetical protein
MCSDSDPLLLLRLYPQLVPPKFVPLLPSTAYGEALPEQQQQASGSSSSVGAADQQQQQQDASAATAAVSVVVPYLLSHRTRLLASLEGAAAAAATAGSSGSSDDAPSSAAADSSSKHKSVQELRLLATVIDTAIQRAMLLQPDSGALLRLLQQVNFVDLEDGESVLTSHGRYAELAVLFQYHKKHGQGLRLLQQLSQAPEGLAVPPAGAAKDLKGLPGVWAAVR